jgi:hypothetical protein
MFVAQMVYSCVFSGDATADGYRPVPMNRE